MDLVAGAQAFQILGEHLKEAGEVGLRRELDKAIRDAAAPVQDHIRASLPAHMPGRYAAVLDADLSLTTATRIGTGTAAGIRLTAKSRVKKRKLSRVEAGILSHPLFGDRQHWYDQTDGMTPRFFAGPITDAVPQMRDKVLEAMRRTADQITRKV